MRTRLLLGFVIFCAGLTIAHAEESVSSVLEADSVVRPQVDAELGMLIKRMKDAGTRSEALRALDKSETQISTLRAKASRQAEPDEIYMDMVTATLKEIPRGKAFKTENCKSYRTGILAQFDPTGEDNPSPAVAKTLEILKVLCAIKKN
jgi:hypothetical protein